MATFRIRRDEMALGVYYPQDIRNALLAAGHASGMALQVVGKKEDNEFARGYQEGYQAALTTIALNFGLIQPDGHHRGCEWR
jgi:hypothetical protein